MTNRFLLFLIFLWLFKQIKNYLFWLYLWQLKNYHWGRFLAHFRTGAGKRIIKEEVFSLVLLASLAFYSLNPYFFLGFFLVVFALEDLAALKNLLNGKLKKPKLTKKIVLLEFFSFILLLIFSSVLVYNLCARPFIVLSGVLLLDFLAPFIVSAVVMFFQPLTIVLRNRTIKKAIKKREKLENLLTIGITGSYGKSSVKEFLKEILSSDFEVVATEKNENSELGISEIILKKVNEKHEIFICEMGAYNRKGIQLLCSIARPKIGIITGISNQHLATFGSQENIVKTKFELIDFLPEEGLAVLNWDSELVRNNFKKKIASLKYGILEKQDAWAENIKVEKDRISFKACFKNKDSINIEAAVVGEHNVINLLAAVSVARKLGMELKDIALACKKMTPEKRISSFQGIDIIDFSYSSNLNGVLAHLEHLKLWSGKKVVIMPCLIELGRDFKETHEKIGKKIAEIGAWAVLTSKECLPLIKKQGAKVIFLNNPLAIQEKIIKKLAPGDVVLLEGRVPDKLIKLFK